MKMKKKDTPKYMKGGEIKKMPGGGKMPMYMYGGKVYAQGGKMLEEMAKDPKMMAQMKSIVGKSK
tara:strand:+ start:21206 stop:21400 length:195 start_codon:yes stop_codon:yes gene_type:complete